jgi:predicted nucleotide-binding protein
MNIHSLIENELASLENPNINLSVVYPNISRIAYYLNDTEEIFWIELNSVNFESLKDVSTKQRLDEIFVGVPEDKQKSIQSRVLSEYLSLRSFKPYDILNQKYQEESIIQSLPVMLIENQVMIMQQNLDSDHITGRGGSNAFNPGDQLKLEVGMRLNNKNIMDILAKLRIRATQYLVSAERKVATTNDDKKIGKIKNKNVFIIHGHNELLRHELQIMLTNDFGLNPMVLSDLPDKGLTIVEKFESYASDCSYAIAIFTPDDVIENNGEKYFQARPNVIFELGWFCAALSRSGVCIVFQEGSNMDIFSDFQGVVQKRFQKSLKEVYRDLRIELVEAGLIIR